MTPSLTATCWVTRTSNIPDGDVGDEDTTPDNSILVTVLDPSEDKKGNDFVDSNNC
jgi:hypothetical protein